MSKKKFNPEDARIKDIEGYEGKYAITSCGRVWSYQKKRFIGYNLLKNGYKQVPLYKNGERKVFLIHVLVARAYLLNPDNLPCVDHIEHECGEIPDNNVNNLRWVTSVINCCNRANARPVFDTVRGQTYCTIAMAARETGKSESTVRRSCEKFRQTKIIQRYLYFEDVTMRIHQKYFRLHPSDLDRNLRA